MATERNIFEQYCDVAINEILEKGYMRSDFDWDVYRHGREIKYIFRIYDKPDENMIAYFVVLLKLKDNQIIMIDDLSKEKRMYDFSLEKIGHKTIPADSYFVMGDNREVSADSRIPEIGVINKKKILGRAKIVIWPLNKIGSVK